MWQFNFYEIIQEVKKVRLPDWKPSRPVSILISHKPLLTQAASAVAGKTPEQVQINHQCCPDPLSDSAERLTRFSSPSQPIPWPALTRPTRQSSKDAPLGKKRTPDWLASLPADIPSGLFCQPPRMNCSWSVGPFLGSLCLILQMVDLGRFASSSCLASAAFSCLRICWTMLEAPKNFVLVRSLTTRMTTTRSVADYSRDLKGIKLIMILFFKKWAIPGLSFFIFTFPIQLTVYR